MKVTALASLQYPEPERGGLEDVEAEEGSVFVIDVCCAAPMRAHCYAGGVIVAKEVLEEHVLAHGATEPELDTGGGDVISVFVEGVMGQSVFGRADSEHPAIQTVQDIFRQNAHRLYHWADDRNVPADNNLAERDLRPLVIARKISFGSQSDAGANTRQTLMTILHTLKKRTPNVAKTFKDALDRLAQDNVLDPSEILFPSDSSRSPP